MGLFGGCLVIILLLFILGLFGVCLGLFEVFQGGSVGVLGVFNQQTANKRPTNTPHTRDGTPAAGAGCVGVVCWSFVGRLLAVCWLNTPRTPTDPPWNTPRTSPEHSQSTPEHHCNTPKHTQTPPNNTQTAPKQPPRLPTSGQQTANKRPTSGRDGRRLLVRLHKVTRSTPRRTGSRKRVTTNGP